MSSIHSAHGETGKARRKQYNQGSEHALRNMYVTSLPNVTIYEEDMMKIKILFFPYQ